MNFTKRQKKKYNKTAKNEPAEVITVVEDLDLNMTYGLE